MYWQEKADDESTFTVPDDVIDLSFKMTCKALPVDHGKLLADELARHIPWLVDDPVAGVHAIHGIKNGNGWESPSEPDALIYPSKRTPLVLRLPKEKASEARQLEGVNLKIGKQILKLETSKIRPLQKTTTLYARTVALWPADDSDEDTFLQLAVERLHEMNVAFKKILCGKKARLRNGENELHTRSLIIAELAFADSIRLQQQGLGAGRHLGCGLFIPHKSI